MNENYPHPLSDLTLRTIDAKKLKEESLSKHLALLPPPASSSDELNYTSSCVPVLELQILGNHERTHRMPRRNRCATAPSVAARKKNAALRTG